MNNEMQLSLLTVQKKQLLVGIINQFCQQLELTDTQYQTAKERYEAVGGWLAEAESPHLKQAKIYAQGSVALETTIKPLGRNEFDVDLVCLLPTVAHSSDAAAVKTLIGERLKEHGKYNGMLEEKLRCWRSTTPTSFTSILPLRFLIQVARKVGNWYLINALFLGNQRIRKATCIVLRITPHCGPGSIS